MIGRNKKGVFSDTDKKIKQRLGGWKKKLLSRDGKEILLKSVAQAMPAYSMSLFLLPIGLCEDLDSIMNRYWWGNGVSCCSGVRWMSWTELCAHKFRGGLSFKRLHEFNLALLSKQGWRFINFPNSLAARIYKAKYFPNSSFLEANLGSNPSYTWRSILAGKGLISDGLFRIIGTCAETKIWGCPWLLDSSDHYIETDIIPELVGSNVTSLMNVHSREWDEDLIR